MRCIASVGLETGVSEPLDVNAPHPAAAAVAGFLVRHSPRRLLGMAAEEAASADSTDRGVA